MNLSEASAKLPCARQTEGSPLFAEPWHAQVLALAHALTANGLFSAREWADSLGSALTDAHQNGTPDTDDTHYACALRALERLIGERSGEISAGLDLRVEEWRSAYLSTPHGNPVELTGRHPRGALGEPDRAPPSEGPEQV